MSVSRVKEDIKLLFECYLEFELKNDKPQVTYKYPNDFSNQDILHNAPVFCFPISDPVPIDEYFSFTITNSLESQFTFGFCLHNDYNKAICFLSYLPWHDFFYRFITMLEKIRHVNQYRDNINTLLDVLYKCPVPKPGPFQFDGGILKCKLQVPDHKGLVSIPDNRNITSFLPALTNKCLFVLYIALMNERRTILTSSSLDKLSAAVYAARDLLYPLYWQHVFIPVLPEPLIDYVAAPMPLLVGLHRSLLERAKNIWGEELVFVDLDHDEMQVPPSLLNEDSLRLPQSIRHSLMEGINGIKKLEEHGESKKIGNKLSRLICVTLVAIVGNYRGSCRFQNSKFSFDQEHFIQSRPPNLHDFISRLLRCQHFCEFIEERIQILQGLKKRDIYEELMLDYYNSGNSKNYLNSWVNDEIMKELNPELAMFKTGAIAFKDLLQDFNRGSGVSSPKLNTQINRTAPPRPIPWHQYKNTISNLPDWLKDNTLPPPHIDDKIFNLLIGNFDLINSDPSNHQPGFERRHTLKSRGPGQRPARLPSQPPPIPSSSSSSSSRASPGTPPTPPSRPASISISAPPQIPAKPATMSNSNNNMNVGQLISLDDDK